MLLFTGALWNWHPHVVGHTPGLQFCCDRRAVPMVRIHFPPAVSQVRNASTGRAIGRRALDADGITRFGGHIEYLAFADPGRP